MFYAHALKSEHAKYALLFYAHAYWWNGLSMPTEVCSVHMPIVITNFKARGTKQDSVPHMINIILTYIPIECGVVDPNV